MFSIKNKDIIISTKYLSSIFRIAVIFDNLNKLLVFMCTLCAIAFIEKLVIVILLFWIRWDFYDINFLLCILYLATFYNVRNLSYNKMDNADAKNQGNDNFAKYVTFISIAFGTTIIIQLGFAFTSCISLFAIDSIINCWCIYLMYDDNKQLFECICGGCQKCIGNCIFCCAHDEKGMAKEECLKSYNQTGAELMTDTTTINVRDAESVNSV